MPPVPVSGTPIYTVEVRKSSSATGLFSSFFLKRPQGRREGACFLCRKSFVGMALNSLAKASQKPTTRPFRSKSLLTLGRIDRRTPGTRRFCRGSRGRASRLWIKCRPDRTRRSRVRSARENRRFSKWKKVIDDFFHGQPDSGFNAMGGAIFSHARDWRTPLDAPRHRMEYSEIPTAVISRRWCARIACFVAFYRLWRGKRRSPAEFGTVI